ncbi:folate transporter 1, chloroplastic isoform X3 [Quercus suber]|uniref:folate transporter 1, chloroplastic isoform X3 n=1 Tax=Quercus suber TaxID=58331 RepID=UPI0032DFF52B
MSQSQPQPQPQPQSKSKSEQWQWENATAGAAAGFATVAAMHPLDVVRTRFQVNDGRLSTLPSYKNTAHAIFTIARLEGLRGLYAGFNPAVIGSTVSWGLYFFFYDRAKQRHSKNKEGKLNPGLHLASAAEAGALVCLCTNPIWLVKTRLQLQTPLHQTQPYSGLYDALRTIMREEGWSALYRGIIPGPFLQVSHGAIQFTANEELRKGIIDLKSKDRKKDSESDDKLLRWAKTVHLGETKPKFKQCVWLRKEIFNTKRRWGREKGASELVRFSFYITCSVWHSSWQSGDEDVFFCTWCHAEFQDFSWKDLS